MRRNSTETVTLDASGTLIKVAVSTLDKLQDTMLGKLVLYMYGCERARARAHAEMPTGVDNTHLRMSAQVSGMRRCMTCMHACDHKGNGELTVCFLFQSMVLGLGGSIAIVLRINGERGSLSLGLFTRWLMVPSS